MVLILKWLFALATAAAFSVGHAQEAPAGKLADDAVQELVRTAIADRFSKNAIPDQGLLSKARPVLVLREMSSGDVMLGPNALPNLPDVPFSLIARDAAQAQANTTKQKVSYIVVDRVAINGTTATLWLGVDFVMPPDPSIIKMCCCSSEANYEKRDGQWHFVKWGYSVCH